MIVVLASIFSLLFFYFAGVSHTLRKEAPEKAAFNLLLALLSCAVTLFMLKISWGWVKAPFITLGLLSLVGCFYVTIKGIIVSPS